MAWYSPIPGIDDALDSMFHPEKGYDAASQQFQKMWEEAQKYQQPYQEAGVNQLPSLTGAESALLDPVALQNQWSSTYTMSPYAQQSMMNAKNAGLDTASSMGLMGSSAALNNVQNSASNIMNQDRQQYMNDLMQKYMTGIGLGKDIYGIGASTAGALGQEAMGAGEELGKAAYGSKTAQGESLKQMMSLAAMLAMQA